MALVTPFFEPKFLLKSVRFSAKWRDDFHMEDTHIVQMYWDRNETAISESAMKYGTYCTSIAQNILQNPADAEECVNDTWLHAWNAMPPHRPSLLSTLEK